MGKGGKSGSELIELYYSSLPPSINALWKRTRSGMRRSDAYVAWLALAAMETRQQKPGCIVGPYCLSVQLARPDKRKRDLDNFSFKAINDLLVQQGVVADDSLCEMLSSRWVTTGEGVAVRVSKAGVDA